MMKIKNNKIELITKSEFARRMNITPGRVNALLKKGIIAQNKNGRLDYKKCKEILESNRQVYAPGKSADPSAYIKAKTKREESLAKIADLEFKKKSKQLIEVNEAQRVYSEALSLIKRRFLDLPIKIAPRLAGHRSPNKIKALLEKEIKRLLKELAEVKEL